MSPSRIALLATVALTCAIPATAQAQLFGQPRTNAQRAQDRQMAAVPRCERPIGSLVIADGDTNAFNAMELQPPQTLLRVVVQRSGCFTLVDRGSAAMGAIERERDLASAGALQLNSNIGSGQMRAADFILLAEVASDNDNASGMGVRGRVGSDGKREEPGRGRRLLGGIAAVAVPVGTAMLGSPMTLSGGMNSQTAEANTVISIINVRTTESVVVAQGYAAKRDIDWNLSGAASFGGFVGGGYENTEIGRIVAQAFINAYAKVVSDMGDMDLSASMPEAAPQATPMPVAVVTQPEPTEAQRPDSLLAHSDDRTAEVLRTAVLRDEPSGRALGTLRAGEEVILTGETNDIWLEIIDKEGNVGWVQEDRLIELN